MTRKCFEKPRFVDLLPWPATVTRLGAALAAFFGGRISFVRHDRHGTALGRGCQVADSAQFRCPVFGRNCPVVSINKAKVMLTMPMEIGLARELRSEQERSRR